MSSRPCPESLQRPRPGEGATAAEAETRPAGCSRSKRPGTWGASQVGSALGHLAPRPVRPPRPGALARALQSRTRRTGRPRTCAGARRGGLWELWFTRSRLRQPPGGRCGARTTAPSAPLPGPGHCPGGNAPAPPLRLP